MTTNFILGLPSFFLASVTVQISLFTIILPELNILAMNEQYKRTLQYHNFSNYFKGPLDSILKNCLRIFFGIPISLCSYIYVWVILDFQFELPSVRLCTTQGTIHMIRKHILILFGPSHMRLFSVLFSTENSIQNLSPYKYVLRNI